MQKVPFIVFAIVLAGQLSVRAAETDDPILAAEKNWAKSVVATDLEALEEIYSDDLIYAHSTGVTESKREYLDKLKERTLKYSLIEHERTKTKIFGDAAIAHSTVRMKGKSPTESFDRKLMMIHVWVKQGGKWRLVAHQTTKLMDNP